VGVDEGGGDHAQIERRLGWVCPAEIVVPQCDDARMVCGRIILESLRVGAELAVPELRVVRVGRHDVAGSAPVAQPAVWTILDVEAPDERAGELAESLAAALDGRGWYADFRVGGDHVIVFPGRIFRYAVGDADGRAAASRHGRAAGVPEHQLDWDDSPRGGRDGGG
jgi:hypothetical protein